MSVRAIVRRTWRRVGSVRVRTTVAATVVVAVAIVAASVALVVLLQRSLTDDVRTAAELRAEDVAQVLRSGPDGVELAVDDDEEMLVQVVDRDGRVVASSENMEGEPPIADLRPGDSMRVPETPIEDDEFLLVAVEAETDDGDLVVIVGRTLETVEEARDTLTGLLQLGVPIVIAVVAIITWWVVGRALAPVEAVRAEAAAISAEALHRRVPVPPTHDEIARLAVTLNEMLDRLERAQARQQRFVADASHELRSPIASIRQHAEVAQTHPDSTTVAELAAAVLDEERRVEQLVDQMLTLARADERVALQHRVVDLDDIVFDEVERARAHATVTVDATKVSAGQVVGDPGQLRHAVRNLLDNALRHARSTVAVSLQEHDETVELAVDDDGPGIPEHERARVFERFVRLDDARSRDRGGAGLGLSIVAAIVAAHGGTVTATDSALGGARVQMDLPAAEEA